MVVPRNLKLCTMFPFKQFQHLFILPIHYYRCRAGVVHTQAHTGAIEFWGLVPTFLPKEPSLSLWVFLFTALFILHETVYRNLMLRQATHNVRTIAAFSTVKSTAYRTAMLPGT